MTYFAGKLPEETLSDKRIEIETNTLPQDQVVMEEKVVYPEEDVKEKTNDFLKELKELKPRPTKEEWHKEIDKLSLKHFGDKLLEGER